MKSISQVPPSCKPIQIFVTTPAVRIVERAAAADLTALANYLVAAGAEHRGRLGFVIVRNGEVCRVVISRDGFQFGWRYIETTVLPLFERAKKVASLPRLRPVAKEPIRKPAPASKPAEKPQPAAEATISGRCTVKAQRHQIFLTRFDVTSGESGQRYTVTVRPGGSPRVACTCPDGQVQASRGKDARCSHAAAVLARRQAA